MSDCLKELEVDGESIEKATSEGEKIIAKLPPRRG